MFCEVKPSHAESCSKRGLALSQTLSHIVLASIVIATSTVAGAASLCVNPGGTAGCQSLISSAVAVASPGDTINVAPGTYKDQVVITKAISIVGSKATPTIIDATGLSNGFFVNGMSAVPATGLSNVVISGFTVRNANYEGILIANASNVTIFDNYVHDNNKLLDVAGAACPGIPAFETSEGMDCGEGIHIMGSNHVSLVRNVSEYNSGGVLISDETGPTYSNLVTGNSVQYNGFACGISMASHPPATSLIPTQRVSFGVMNNTITHNLSAHNGVGGPDGYGAGIGIFAPSPGTTNTGNVVSYNELSYNGHPGVSMHNHAAPPMAPPVVFDNNVIVGNYIHNNSADTADAHTSGPTGINILSQTPINGTVIAENVFEDESVDVAFNATAGQLNAHFNDFKGLGIGIDNLGTGTIDATENWWHCPTGPAGASCKTAAGPSISSTPWLTQEFETSPTAF